MIGPSPPATDPANPGPPLPPRTDCAPGIIQGEPLG